MIHVPLQRQNEGELGAKAKQQAVGLGFDEGEALHMRRKKKSNDKEAQAFRQ